MKFRHEWKHKIDYQDLFTLRHRLRPITKADPHATDGKYTVRSLYFDNANDKVLKEKMDGVNLREKFRIRYYNDDTSFIHLEKKSKINGLCHKTAARLTAEQTQSILDGNYHWMVKSDTPLIRELYIKMVHQALRPKTIVEYTREPYVFSPGNVRITLDYNLRTAMSCTCFLDPSALLFPSGDKSIILEVKWDEFLPDIIGNAVHLQNCRVGSFSKYAACRIYG